MEYNLISVIGPTATGKTSLAVAFASKKNAEIISADSRQVYRGMDIGTGKDLDEYSISGASIPYHLIDIVEAGYKYNVFEYQRDFLKIFEKITNEGKLPVLCGGSGLYIEAVLKGYKLVEVPPDAELRKLLENKSLVELINMLSSMKKLHNTTDVDTVKRAIRAIEIEIYSQKNPAKKTFGAEIKSLNFGIYFDRQKQKEKISIRLKERLENGMIDEVQRILNQGISSEDLIYYGLEYKFVTEYLIGKLKYDEMFRLLEIAIHQFSKRQMTWFRRMERNGVEIHWINGTLSTEEKVGEMERVWGK